MMDSKPLYRSARTILKLSGKRPCQVNPDYNPALMQNKSTPLPPAPYLPPAPPCSIVTEKAPEESSAPEYNEEMSSQPGESGSLKK
jgi:hypothetical protein